MSKIKTFGEKMKRIKNQEIVTPTNITGKSVRKARIKAKLSQAQLSAKLEMKAVYICRGSLSRIENGVRIVTDVELSALSEVLGISLRDLFNPDGRLTTADQQRAIDAIYDMSPEQVALLLQFIDHL